MTEKTNIPDCNPHPLNARDVACPIRNRRHASWPRGHTHPGEVHWRWGAGACHDLL